MAFTNFETKEINCKIVYFGPNEAGKLTNFRSIYAATSRQIKSDMLELGAKDGDSNFFSFLPISMGKVKDYHLKAHLFILPKHSLFETVPSVILKGLDGYVFVADSSVESMGANIESLLKTKKILSEEGYNLSDLPGVIQYNKRDQQDIVSVDIMREELNASGLIEIEAIASESIGTMETLQAMAKQVVNKLAD
jgi:signal recognition particle receptor subunit beta